MPSTPPALGSTHYAPTVLMGSVAKMYEIASVVDYGDDKKALRSFQLNNT